MKARLRNLIALGVVLTGLMPILAQKEPKDETFQFTTRAFGNDYFEGIRFYDAEGELALLEFDPYARTGVYHLPKESTEVAFVRLVPDNRGRDREEVVGVADLDGIESRAFIVLVASRDQRRDLPYTVYVADESPGQFEAGHLRFLNLAGPPLLARVGEATYSLEYGFGGDIQFEPDSIKELPFQFAVRTSEEWRIVYSSGFRAHPDVGTLAILKPPISIDSMQIQVELTQRRYFFDPVKETEASPDDEG